MNSEDLSSSLIDEIISYCKEKAPEEACGFIVKIEGAFVFSPCTNVSSQDKTEFFAIHPLDYSDAADKGEIAAVVHSHTKTGAEFSQNDRDYQSLEGLPWMLIGLGRGSVEIAWLNEPKKVLPLYGRPYKWHIYDCYSFIRDYYQELLGIDLLDFYREKEFWKKDEELYLDNFQKAGFREVPIKDIQEHDVILFQIGSKITSHGAVYLGGNMIGHHLRGVLSCKEVFGKFYQDRAVMVARHERMFK